MTAVMCVKIFVLICVVKASFASPLNPGDDQQQKFGTENTYIRLREQLVAEDSYDYYLVSDKLSDNEKIVQRIVMNLKHDELKEYRSDMTIAELLAFTKKSKLFQIIRRMPKGGLLRAHITALCNIEFVIRKARKPLLWQLSVEEKEDPSEFDIREYRFSRSKPENKDGKPFVKDGTKYEWYLVHEKRRAIQAKFTYDNYLRSKLSIFNEQIATYPACKSHTEAWKKVRTIARIQGGIVKYKPVWKAMMEQILIDLQEDNIQYLEFHSTLTNV